MRRSCVVTWLILALAVAASAQVSGTITTVAGNGTLGAGGDGGPALNASFNKPYGLTAATEANSSISLYLSDTFNNRLRKITADGRVQTFAGSAVAGYGGDGGPATSASLNINTTSAIGPGGEVYIADFNGQRIRKVDASGRISTFAGVGVSGFAGDNGPAVQARFAQPMGIALGPDGTLYVADRDNHRIRKIDSYGTITTIAGNGTAAFSGDGGPAAQAQLSFPTGVFVGPNGIYVADWGNARIRRIDPQGIMSTVAGNGVIGFSGDRGPAVAAALNEPRNVIVVGGFLFIADSGNHRIRRVTLADGTINTFAGTGAAGFSGDNGPAASAQLNFPQAISLGSDGALYIADTDNHRVRRVAAALQVSGSSLALSSPQLSLTAPAGAAALPAYSIRVLSSEAALSFAATATTASGGNWLTVATPATTTPATIAITIDPSGLTPGNYSGTVIVTAPSAANPPQQLAVRLLIAPAAFQPAADSGTIITVAGSGVRGFSGDEGPATAAALNQPHGLTVGVLPDFTVNLFLSDTFNHRIRKVNLDTGRIDTFAGRGLAGYLPETEGALATVATLNVPAGLAFRADGEVFIADLNNSRLRRVDRVNRITTYAGTGVAGYTGEGTAIEKNLFLPISIVSAPDGSQYVVDRNNHRVRRIDPNGVISTVAGNGEPGFGGDEGLATDARLSYPTGLALGLDGSLFIADWLNHRIRQVDPNGIIRTVAGTGVAGFTGDGPALESQLNEPLALALAGNFLYLTDSKNHLLRRLDLADRTLTTVAGTGSPGFSGDSGPARRARLNTPQAIAVGPDGSVFIADTGNDRVRRIIFSTPDAVTEPSRLQVSSGQVAFAGVAGQTGLTEQTIALTSSGAPLEFSATAAGNPSWLRLGSSNGQTPTNLSLSVSAEGLTAGTYRATVTFTSAAAANSPQALQVVYTVAAPPTVLTAAPDSLEFLAVQGAGDPATQVVRVSSSRAAAGLVIQVSGGASWVQVERTTGAEPWELTIRCRPAGLAAGFYATTISVTGTNVAVPLSLPITLRVSPAPVAVVLAFDPPSLQFRALTESAAPAPRTVQLAATAGAGSYSVTATSFRNWLGVSTAPVSPRPGSPATLEVRVNSADLGPGSYEGEIAIADGGGVRARLPVQLFVTQPINPSLIVDTPLVQLSAPAGETDAIGQVVIKNPSSTNLRFRISASTADGNAWLEANPTVPDSVSLEKPTLITVRANARNLAQGTYSGTIELTAEQGGLISQLVSVPVVFAVLGQPLDLAVSQSALSFSARTNTTQTLDLSMVAIGSGSLPWTARVTQGAGFLRLSKSGDTATGRGPAQLLDVQFVANGLSPGEYHGEIQVQALGAPRPIVVSVLGRVTSGSPDPIPTPSSLAFVPKTGGGNPDPRGVFLLNASGNVLFNTLPSPDNPSPGIGWLKVEPRPGTPGQYQAAVAFDGLAAGTYRATVNFSFAGNATAQSQILAVRPGAPSTFSAENKFRSAAGCTPTKFFPLFASAQPRFNLLLGQPLQTEIVVVDDCGELATNVAACSYFNNGEPSLGLVPIGDGRWSATWVPKINESGEVLLDTLATDVSRSVEPAKVSVRAFLAGNTLGPVLAARDSVLSIDGTPARAIAPGSRIEIRGVRLATQGAATVTLGGASLEVLTATAERITAVVPANFDGRGRQSLVVRNAGRQSAPLAIVVADLWPIVASVAAADGSRLQLNVSGLAEAAASGDLSTLVFAADDRACRASALAPLEPGLWRLDLADCSVLEGQPSSITAGTRQARSQDISPTRRRK